MSKIRASSRARPKASSRLVTARMTAQRRRDTAPEMLYRRALARMGLRYRVDYRLPSLRRRGDIVFTRRKVVIFIDGCFWHSCPLHASTPKRNRAWWVAKLRANAARDKDTDRRLLEQGWRTIRVWEHEKPGEVIPRILAALTSAAHEENRKA